MQNVHIEQIGSPLAVYDRRANTFVAGFIGSPSMNLIEVTAHRNGADWDVVVGDTRLPVEAGEGLSEGQAVLLGVRPEHLVLSEAHGLPTQVTAIEPTGSEMHVLMRTHGTDVVSVSHERLQLTSGQEIFLSVAPENAHLFDRESGQRIG
jgi:multiple sugar transport system ATP-binding protein